jgi:hypothetical protein
MSLAKECARAFLEGKRIKLKTVIDDLLEFVLHCNDYIVLVCFHEDGPYFKDKGREARLQNAVQDRINSLTREQLPSIKNDFFQLASRFDNCTDPAVIDALTEAFTQLLDSVTLENCPDWATYALLNIEEGDMEPKETVPHWKALAERLTG